MRHGKLRTVHAFVDMDGDILGGVDQHFDIWVTGSYHPYGTQRKIIAGAPENEEAVNVPMPGSTTAAKNIKLARLGCAIHPSSVEICLSFNRSLRENVNPVQVAEGVFGLLREMVVASRSACLPACLNGDVSVTWFSLR
jgi:hypothetical protein